MVVKKKPYFFVYLYQSLMNEYKEYTKSFNNLSLKQFGCPIKSLIKKQNKSDSEMNLVRKYQKYSPVLETDCIMNKVCKSFENAEFDIKYKNNGISLLDKYFDHKNINETLTNNLYNIYKEFKNQKKFKGISTIVENYGIQDDDMNDLFKNIFFSNRDNCKNKVYDLMSNTKEIFDNLIYMCKTHNLNYDIVWDIMGEDILDIINYENNVIIIEDQKGEEYLGKKYSIKEIYLESIGDEV